MTELIEQVAWNFQNFRVSQSRKNRKKVPLIVSMLVIRRGPKVLRKKLHVVIHVKSIQEDVRNGGA